MLTHWESFPPHWKKPSSHPFPGHVSQCYLMFIEEVSFRNELHISIDRIQSIRLVEGLLFYSFVSLLISSGCITFAV